MIRFPVFQRRLALTVDAVVAGGLLLLLA